MADAPKPMPNESNYTRVQVVELQREILQFLGGVAGMEMGVLSLVRNQNVLPRLVKRIAEELEEVYEFKSGRDQRFVLIYLLSSRFLFLFPAHMRLPG